MTRKLMENSRRKSVRVGLRVFYGRGERKAACGLALGCQATSGSGGVNNNTVVAPP
jgi:hypothetical protein